MKTDFKARLVVLIAIAAVLGATSALAQRDLFDVIAHPRGGIGPQGPPEFVGTYLYEVDAQVIRQWGTVSGLITFNADGCATATSVVGVQKPADFNLQTHGVWKSLSEYKSTGRFLTLRRDHVGRLVAIERMTVALSFNKPLGGATGTMTIEHFHPEQLDDALGPNTNEVPLGGTSRGQIVLRRLNMD